MKNNKYVRFSVFLLFNFLALWIGVILMNDGPRTPWYLNLNKAPWTPPSWVFGTAWSTIMLLFAVYMTRLSFQFKFFNKKLITLYTLQWILNVSWNYVFFNRHLTGLGLLFIVSLWLLVGFFLFKFHKKTKLVSVCMLPYWIWLTLATSLNAYIVLYN